MGYGSEVSELQLQAELAMEADRYTDYSMYVGDDEFNRMVAELEGIDIDVQESLDKIDGILALQRQDLKEWQDYLFPSEAEDCPF